MVRSYQGAMSRRTMVLAGAAAFVLPAAAKAQGDPILTLVLPNGQRVEFSDADIAGMQWAALATHTAWTEGLQHFRGPLLADVLSPIAGAPIDLALRNLTMTALNDFVVDVPASDAWTFRPLLAREANGRPMRVRDKGPLWLVYPRDETPALQNPLMDERWIWQIRQIEIR